MQRTQNSHTMLKSKAEARQLPAFQVRYERAAIMTHRSTAWRESTEEQRNATARGAQK